MIELAQPLIEQIGPRVMKEIDNADPDTVVKLAREVHNTLGDILYTEPEIKEAGNEESQTARK